MFNFKKKSTSGLTKSSKYFDQLRKAAKKKTNKITLEDAKPQIDEILEFLTNCDEYTSEEVGDALNDLVTIPEDMSMKLTQDDLAKNRRNVGEYLNESGYAKLFVNIVSSLKSHVRIHAKVKISGALENFKIVLRGFSNYTAWSEQLQVAFAAEGGAGLLFPLLEYIDKNLTLCDPKSKPYALIQQIILFLIPILQNCIKYCSKNRTVYREANAFKILSNLSNSDQNVKLMALLTMAYVVDDQQSASLSRSHDCIKLLTEMLDQCTKSSDHSVIIHPICYSSREILDGLNHLIINDDNKVELQKCGGIQVIAQIIDQESFTDDEKQLAVETIGALAFVKSIRETQEMTGVASSLEKYASSENASLSEASKYALFQLKDDKIPEADEEITTTISAE